LDLITHLSFAGVCVQAISNDLRERKTFLRRVRMEKQKSAAASRWRQCDGRSVQNGRDE
jgi:hypothetical protein